jgi:hypothetical protein
MEKMGYLLLFIVLLFWLVGIVVGCIAAFPFGIVGLLALAGFGFLFVKATKDRLANKEDDYYSKNVDK